MSVRLKYITAFVTLALAMLLSFGCSSYVAVENTNIDTEDFEVTSIAKQCADYIEAGAREELTIPEGRNAAEVFDACKKLAGYSNLTISNPCANEMLEQKKMHYYLYTTYVLMSNGVPVGGCGVVDGQVNDVIAIGDDYANDAVGQFDLENQKSVYLYQQDVVGDHKTVLVGDATWHWYQPSNTVYPRGEGDLDPELAQLADRILAHIPKIEPTAVTLGSWKTTDQGTCFEYLDGSYATGITDICGELYAFSNEGLLEYGWIEKDGNWYLSNSEGLLYKDKWHDTYWFDNTGKVAEYDPNK